MRIRILRLSTLTRMLSDAENRGFDKGFEACARDYENYKKALFAYEEVAKKYYKKGCE